MAISDLVWHRWTGPGSFGRVNQNTDDAFREAYRLFRKVYPKVPLPYLTQGGMFGLGGADPDSGGTHDGGGVGDFGVRDLTRVQILYFVTCLRWVGFAAWFRPEISGTWPDHIHAVRIGDRSLSDAASRQVTDFKNRLTGLASGRKDTLHQWVGWTTWEEYSRDLNKPRSEFFGMAANHRLTKRETRINVGVETALPINDDGDLSLLAGPVADYYVGINIRVVNLPTGEVLRLYASTWDYKSGLPSELVSKGMQHEIIGTGGNTYASVSFDGLLGKSSKSGYSRRLRILAETDSQGTDATHPVAVTRLATTTRKA